MVIGKLLTQRYSKDTTQKAKHMRFATLSALLIILLTANPMLVFGGCVNGDCKNGTGTFNFKDGSVYIGQFKDGQLTGQGSFKYPDGTTQTGTFNNGIINTPDNDAELNNSNSSHKSSQAGHVIKSCEDDTTVPLKARMYCTSGIYWFGRGDIDKANEYLRNAAAIHPNFPIVKQKLHEVKTALSEREYERNRIRAEEYRRAAERRRQNEIVVAQRKQIEEQNKRAALEQAAVDATIKQRKVTICSQCAEDCKVNKYQFNNSCYAACASTYGLEIFCQTILH